MDIFEGHERTCTSKADMTEVYSHAMPCFFVQKLIGYGQVMVMCINSAN